MMLCKEKQNSTMPQQGIGKLGTAVAAPYETMPMLLFTKQHLSLRNSTYAAPY